MSVKSSPGCAVIVLVLIGIFSLYTYYVSNPKEAKKEHQELIDNWGEQTVRYYSDFSCSELQYEELSHNINKFFVIESHLDHPCEISIYSRTDQIFGRETSLQSYYSKNITKVNTIIWIQSVAGNSEARYSDGSQAYRLIAEINFIDKDTKKIYKKRSVEFTGGPRGEIKRIGNKNKGGNVYFGDKPYDEIFDIILNEINNENTMANKSVIANSGQSSKK